MGKIVRILSHLEQIRNKRNLSIKIRMQLMASLIHLEFFSFLQPNANKEIITKILNFKVVAFGYSNLCILFREIFIHEEYQYFKSDEQAPIIIDCGANIGIASLYFKWKFPQSQIHAFEPDPTAFTLLEKNIKINKLDNIKIYNKAAMDKAGKIQFFQSKHTKASLMMSTLKERIDESTIDVEGIDFATFINQSNATLLKMDIEGAENSILEKIHSELGFGNVRQIVMEYHHKIENHPSKLSRILFILEQHQFEYNLITRFEIPGGFQDILIYACKN